MARKVRINRIVKFPEKLISEVNNIDYDKERYRNHTFRLLDRIIQNYFNKDINFNEFISLPKNYIKKIIGAEYHIVTKKLKEHGILEVQMSLDKETGQLKESYSATYHKSKYYRLNFHLMKDTNFKSISYKDVKEKNNIDPDLFNYQKEILKRLVIDEKEAINDIERRIKVTKNDIRINTEISEDSFKVNDYINKKQYFINLLEKVLTLEGYVIQDKHKFYIVKSVEEFLNDKNEMIKHHNLNSITKLIKKFIHISRNETNNRLDTNITNLSNKLIKHIKLDNENLLSIDLNNSQFILLSDIIYKIINNKINKINIFKEINLNSIIDLDLYRDILTNKDDVERFIKLSSEGKLYDEIQRSLSLKNRNEAKTLMFEVLFSSYRYNSKRKNKIKELFPNIFEFVKQYKKKFGDNSFAIMLQKYESMLFIDNILHNAMNNGLDALTKHDSLLVKTSDAKQGNDLVKNELNKILDIKYKLSYTNYGAEENLTGFDDYDDVIGELEDFDEELP